MARLLMLAHRLPYPPNKGDKIRSYHVLAHLARRHEVWLASLVDDPVDLGHLDTLRSMTAAVAIARIDGSMRRVASLRAIANGRSITVTHFHVQALQAQVDAWIAEQRFDGVFCSSAATAEYLFRSQHPEGRLRALHRVMDLIDVDSAKWSDYARKAAPGLGALYRYESRVLARYERRIVEEFDRVFVVSREEATLLGAGARVDSFSNGVDLEYFEPRPETGGELPLIVFTGAMDYLPNIDAVVWFAENVLPVVRVSVRDARFAIVGSRPAPAVRRLSNLPGVIVTGFVDDVRDWIARADVCVAPLRIARGIQNKVLEAMAMARPVVASPEAFEGLDATEGEHLIVARDAASFAEGVIALLRDRDRGRMIGRRARIRAEERYRWSTNLAVLDEVFA